MSDTMINTADLEARLSEATTLEQRLAAFGEILAVDRPVSKQVLFGALQDPTMPGTCLSRGAVPA